MKKKSPKSIAGFILGLLVFSVLLYPHLNAIIQEYEHEEVQEEDRLRGIEIRLEILENRCPSQSP